MAAEHDDQRGRRADPRAEPPAVPADADALPAGEPTVAEPDQLETIDGLGPRGRAARAEVLAAVAAAAASNATAPGEASEPGAEPPRVEGLRVGRYQLLEMVGAGGMGMVWGAWDPELERRVALKLVQPTVLAARERILTEGQALAKLSHPNVVPIYDVGVMGAQVYLVMEWVRGTTLRAYGKTAPNLRALLEAYHQAGAGLAAAHRAGIVHRDFKPDNVIRGDDGRVRVLDFGLAQSDVAAASASGVAALGSQSSAPLPVAGTPRYMAPEQARGEAAVAASDQYAFCISLGESVAELAKRQGGKGPSWISAVVTRGTAREPTQRFPSMDALLAALGQDPARRWRRRAAVAAIAASAIGAFAVGRLRAHDARVEPCAGSSAAIATAWSPTARGELLDHLHGLGVLGAAEPKAIGEELDTYSAAWAAEHRRSCLARERGELTPQLYERRLGCLARGRAQLAAVTELLSSVPAPGLAAALIARRGLPPPDACAAVDESTVVPPPAEAAAAVAAVVPAVERALVLGVAQRPEALVAAQAGVAAAWATGYSPLIARALLVQGRTETALNRGAAAATTLTAALALALQVFDDVLAVEAYARLVWVAEYRDPPDSWLVMAPLAERVGPRGRFGRALLYNNLGGRHYRAKQRDKARASLLRALEESELSTGKEPEDVELVSILRNLALIEPDAATRQTLAERAAAALERSLGRNHPRTIIARELATMLTRNPAKARPQLEEVCPAYEPWKLPNLQAVCAFEAGWLADEQNDFAAAIGWMRMAEADPRTASGERIKGRIAAGYVALASAAAPPILRGFVDELRAGAAKALTSPDWWYRVDAADAYAVTARMLDQLGRSAEADEAWRLALAALDGIDEPVYERRVARMRAAVAERLAKQDPAQAQQLAAAALEWYALAGGYEAAIARLEPIARPR